jgi:hypothetical protein
MPKLVIDHLLTQLHDTFGDEQPSAEVDRLMRDMKHHMNQWNTPSPEEEMVSTAHALLAELEVDHPQAVSVARKLIETLSNIGV